MVWTRSLYACVVLGAGLGGPLAADRRPIILRPQFDPAAERIDLFAGIADSRLSVRMIPHDETHGALFIENQSLHPLTVELPEVLVGVQVLPQIGLQFPVPTGTVDGAANGTSATTGSGNQPVGGRATGTGSTTPNASSGPTPFASPAFFSVPAERVVRIEYSSVCLRHGAPTPNSGNVYRPVRANEFSSDARLRRVLQSVGDPRYSTAATQAAAWHVLDGLSWEQLAAQQIRHLNAPDEPQFTTDDLAAAQRLLRE